MESKTRVLLISPNTEKKFGPIPPLGAACVAAAVRKAGHSVKLVDLCFEEDIKRATRTAVNHFAPDVIGISLRNVDNTICLAPVFFVPMLKTVVDECRELSEAPIVLGGSGFTLLPEPILRYCDVELGIVGEGEIAFCQLLKALEEDGAIDAIPGIAMFRQGGYLRNQPLRPPILDELPAPAWDLLDARYYSFHAPPSVRNMETKRGCAFHCSYCTYPVIQGRTVRLRSPSSVAEEMTSLHEDFGFGYVEIVDNVFNYPVEHAIEICRELIRGRSQMQWACSLHPGHVTKKLLAMMARAGCRRVEFGADSASQQMLQNLRKDFDIGVLTRSLTLCKATDIDIACYILLGGPGEDINTIEETLINLEKLNPPSVYFMYGIRIYPNTRIWEIAQTEGMKAGKEDLLEPKFYLSNSMNEKTLNLVTEHVQSHPNWIMLGIGGQEHQYK